MIVYNGTENGEWFDPIVAGSSSQTGNLEGSMTPHLYSLSSFDPHLPHLPSYPPTNDSAYSNTSYYSSANPQEPPLSSYRPDESSLNSSALSSSSFQRDSARLNPSATPVNHLQQYQQAIPPPPPSIPLPSRYDPTSHDNSDLASLRQIQRQRKRESSSSSSLASRQDATSALMGFAGTSQQRLPEGYPLIPPQYVPLPLSPLQPSPQAEPTRPDYFAAQFGPSSSHYPLTYDSSSTNPSPFPTFPSSLPHPSFEQSVYPASYPLPPAIPAYNPSLSLPSPPLHTRSQSNPSTARFPLPPPPVPSSQPLSFRTSTTTTTTDFGSEDDIHDPSLIPILEQGLEIRKKHRLLPAPFSIRPGRGKPFNGGSKGGDGKKKGVKEEGEEEGGNDGELGEEEVEWDWKVGRNSHGSINSVEVKVRCTKCRQLLSPSPRFDGMKKKKKKKEEERRVARLILRNLSNGVLSNLGRTTSDTSTFPEPSPADFYSLDTVLPQIGIALVEPLCLACTGFEKSPLSTSTTSRQRETSTTTTGSAGEQDKRERGYEDTLSAAIDRFEQMSLGVSKGSDNLRSSNEAEVGNGRSETTLVENEGPEDTNELKWKEMIHANEADVPSEWRDRLLKCDVCNLVCGLCSVEPLSLSTTSSTTASPAHHSSSSYSSSSGKKASTPFSVEVICARCDALFKICSSCGGGGGRLSTGRWRCKELFPNGRKNCLLSHARNPTLNEISIVVNPVKTFSPQDLSEASAACRRLFFNTRLGTLCRPEFMLNADGLASTYREAEMMSVDFWGRLEELLTEDVPDNSPVKRYLTITYSQHQRRSSRTSTTMKSEDDDVEEKPSTRGGRGKKGEKTDRGIKQVPWAFSIIEVDFSVGVLFFCCVIPWATSGQSFDANSLLIERTNERVKLDLSHLNQIRITQGLAPYPRLRYNFVVSPFRLDSKNSLNLNRRGYLTLDQLEQVDPNLDRTLFPPYREIWLPAHYSKASVVFVRELQSEEDMGAPPSELAPRKRKKTVG